MQGGRDGDSWSCGDGDTHVLYVLWFPKMPIKNHRGVVVEPRFDFSPYISPPLGTTRTGLMNAGKPHQLRNTALPAREPAHNAQDTRPPPPVNGASRVDPRPRPPSAHEIVCGLISVICVALSIGISLLGWCSLPLSPHKSCCSLLLLILVNHVLGEPCLLEDAPQRPLHLLLLALRVPDALDSAAPGVNKPIGAAHQNQRVLAGWRQGLSG